MPWQLEPMKDVAACDKSWCGGKQPLTQECPNGETYIVEDYMSLHRGGVADREPREVKHLSNARKRKKAH